MGQTMLATKAPEILDEKSFLEAANDSARHFRNIYTVYLILLVYTAVLILSTDQELLFRPSDKPFLNVNIHIPVHVSIFVLYMVMPWGLFIIHLYLLIHASFLADKVRLYMQEIAKPKFKSDKARKLLFPVLLAHLLTGGKERGQWILRVIIILSLIVLPIVELMSILIVFLPSQSERIIWSHRIVIMFDIALLWYFWFRLFPLKSNKLGKKVVRISIWLISTISTLIIIVIYADFPGSIIYRSVTSGFHQYIGVPPILNHFDLPGYILVKREPLPEILVAYYMRDDDIKPDDINPGSEIWCKHTIPLDLKNRNFRHANLNEAVLCAANLSGADLGGSTLTDANLRGANLTYADLADADLIRANLIYADLTDAGLFRANLTDADLTDAGLFRANLTDADLTDADLIRANLIYADLTDAYLWRANLTDADLIRANLIYADLTDAYLWRANLTDADLTDADLTEADLRRANLTDADLTDADLFRANLTAADLTDADLTDADLFRANLTAADLTDADLTAADLTYADLTYADLTDADLTEADLTDADLIRANLIYADLTDADLTDAYLWRANLTDADLRLANLTDADLSNANLFRAIFWGANISNADFTGAKNVNIELSWIREGANKNKTQHRPKGIPKNTNIKSCPADFYISGYITISNYLATDGTIAEEKRDDLKNAIKDTLDKHCQ